MSDKRVLFASITSIVKRALKGEIKDDQLLSAHASYFTDGQTEQIAFKDSKNNEIKLEVKIIDNKGKPNVTCC